jgi:hypothetical protein
MDYCEMCNVWFDKGDDCPECQRYQEDVARSLIPGWAVDQYFGRARA